MMVGWIAFLFGLSCFLVGFFSLRRFGPAPEGEDEKKIWESAGGRGLGRKDFWDNGSSIRS